MKTFTTTINFTDCGEDGDKAFFNVVGLAHELGYDAIEDASGKIYGIISPTEVMNIEQTMPDEEDNFATMEELFEEDVCLSCMSHSLRETIEVNALEVIRNTLQSEEAISKDKSIVLLNLMSIANYIGTKS